jgi:hypothetical protein
MKPKIRNHTQKATKADFIELKNIPIKQNMTCCLMKLKNGNHIQKAPKADSIEQKNIPISA